MSISGTQRVDVGSQFGKYLLLKKLAAGGMGEIFLAKQQGPAGFEKLLVVKKVLGHLTQNREFVELFLGEARLAARMNHRNIVQVFELGEHEGTYFIAMEYVPGKTLREVIDSAARKGDRLHPDLCRSIAEQICDGASYAHNLTDVGGRSLNIIHRDLNPQNVLIGYGGDVKIIDFGIAKSDLNTVKTEAGMIKGKFVYMSPEQSLAKRLDKRSDVFSIGIALYEMLAGSNPFHKSNIVLTLEAVQRLEPARPSELDVSYAPFDPIIAKALAKERDARYADAADMQDDLRRIVLPRAPERLGTFMGRMFRSSLAEEQQLAQSSPRRQPTPPRPVAPEEAPGSAGSTVMLSPSPRERSTPAHERSNEAPVAPGGTVMLSPSPRRESMPPKPGAAPQPSRAPGAGDTLLDGSPPPPGISAGSPASGRGGDTMVLAPASGPQAKPAPGRGGDTIVLSPGSAEKAKPATGRIGDTMLLAPAGEPDAKAVSGRTGETMVVVAGEATDGKTAFVGTAPSRLRKSNGASTSILDPEEAAAAQRNATKHVERAQRQPVRAKPRPHRPARARKRFIALGAGALVAIGVLGALAFWVLGDEAPARRARRATTALPAERAYEASAAPIAVDTADAVPAPAAVPISQEKVAATPRRAAAAPPDEADPDRKPEPRGDGPKMLAQGKLFGTLMVNPHSAPVTFAGTPLPKQVGAYNLPVTGESGVLDVGDASTEYTVHIAYRRTGSALKLKVSTSPSATVWLNGAELGASPVNDVALDSAQSVLELKRAGAAPGVLLRLQYRALRY